jgi:hypothetical protein
VESTKYAFQLFSVKRRMKEFFRTSKLPVEPTSSVAAAAVAVSQPEAPMHSPLGNRVTEKNDSRQTYAQLREQVDALGDEQATRLAAALVRELRVQWTADVTELNENLSLPTSEPSDAAEAKALILSVSDVSSFRKAQYGAFKLVIELLQQKQPDVVIEEKRSSESKSESKPEEGPKKIEEQPTLES